jgi:hypothetical protein
VTAIRRKVVKFYRRVYKLRKGLPSACDYPSAVSHFQDFFRVSLFWSRTFKMKALCYKLEGCGFEAR